MHIFCSLGRRNSLPSGIQAPTCSGRWRLVQMLLTVLLIVLSVASGCDLLPPDMTRMAPSPTAPVQPTIVPYRPLRVAQVCLDTPPFFPADLFHQAANKIADWTMQDVTLNQGGLLVYISLITHQSYQNNVMTINVPAFATDTPAPTPSPTPAPTPGENPYQSADMQATVAAKNEQAQSQWQAAMQQRHADLSRAQKAVKKQTDTLHSLTPPYDDTGSDVNGCLQNAMQHFRLAQGEKYLIIASAFINNTAENWTPDLQLFHAHARGMYRVCQSAPVCARQDQAWTAAFLRAGASSDVAFYDPAQSAILDPQF
jgi:hypothetical protein